MEEGAEKNEINIDSKSEGYQPERITQRITKLIRDMDNSSGKGIERLCHSAISVIYDCGTCRMIKKAPSLHTRTLSFM